MTNREFYQKIIEANINDEFTAFATEAIEKLDHTNELRKASTAKKALEKEAERAPIREALVGCLTDEFKTATTLIAEAGVETTPQSVPSLFKALIADGTIIKDYVKVEGKGKHIGYARAN